MLYLPFFLSVINILWLLEILLCFFSILSCFFFIFLFLLLLIPFHYFFSIFLFCTIFSFFSSILIFFPLWLSLFHIVNFLICIYLSNSSAMGSKWHKVNLLHRVRIVGIQSLFISMLVGQQRIKNSVCATIYTSLQETNGFIPFLRALKRNETQTAPSTIWTQRFVFLLQLQTVTTALSRRLIFHGRFFPFHTSSF